MSTAVEGGIIIKTSLSSVYTFMICKGIALTLQIYKKKEGNNVTYQYWDWDKNRTEIRLALHRLTFGLVDLFFKTCHLACFSVVNTLELKYHLALLAAKLQHKP